MLIFIMKANRPATDKLRTKTKTLVEMSRLRVRNALACKSLIKRWKLQQGGKSPYVISRIRSEADLEWARGRGQRDAKHFNSHGDFSKTQKPENKKLKF